MERPEIPMNKGSSHRSSQLFTYYVVGTLLLLSVAWNIYLTVNQKRLYDRLSKLDVNQEKLFAVASSNPSVYLPTTTNDEIVWRVRREANVEPKGDLVKQKVKAKKRRRRKVSTRYNIYFLLYSLKLHSFLLNQVAYLERWSVYRLYKIQKRWEKIYFEKGLICRGVWCGITIILLPV